MTGTVQPSLRDVAHEFEKQGYEATMAVNELTGHQIPSSSIEVAMGDQRPFDRPDRIDVEAAGLAAKPGRDGHQDVLRAHWSYIGGQTAMFSRHARA